MLAKYWEVENGTDAMFATLVELIDLAQINEMVSI